MKNLKLIIVLIMVLISQLSPVYARKSFVSARLKACYSNIRVLEDAIKLYNLDNKEEIHELNQKTLQLLVDNKYLKAIPGFPDPKCSYSNSADLTANGGIYCVYHGSIGYNSETGLDQNGHVGMPPSPEIEPYANGEDPYGKRLVKEMLIFIGIIVLSICVVVSFIRDLRKSK